MRIESIKNPKFKFYNPNTWHKVTKVTFEDEILITNKVELSYEGVFETLNGSLIYDLDGSQARKEEALKEAKEFLDSPSQIKEEEDK